MPDIPLWVIVDDTSLEIQYEGDSWYPDVGTFDSESLGNYGAPYRSTQHGTKSSASLSFSFFGHAVMVTGTMLLVSTNVTESGLDPLWDCFIDGVSIGSNPTVGTWLETNKNLCGPTQCLEDGQHTVTVNVTSKTGQPFWIDTIEYAAPENVELENKVVKMLSDYPALRFGPGWTESLGMKMTSMKDAIFEFTFEGISLEWYAALPKDSARNATTGSYTIDDQDAISFNLPGYPSHTPNDLYHIKIFQTPTLPMGQHRLSVVYGGGPDLTPLLLYYLVVQNGSVPQTTPSSMPSGPANMPSTPATETQTHHGLKLGPLVGGVAGLGLLCVLSLIAFFWWKRRSGMRITNDATASPFIDNSYVAPFDSSIPITPKSFAESGRHMIAQHIGVSGASPNSYTALVQRSTTAQGSRQHSFPPPQYSAEGSS